MIIIKKISKNDALDYSANSVMIRIRCGWKPAPSKIMHQTLENELPMHVACNFDRVLDILNELKNTSAFLMNKTPFAASFLLSKTEKF